MLPSIIKKRTTDGRFSCLGCTFQGQKHGFKDLGIPEAHILHKFFVANSDARRRFVSRWFDPLLKHPKALFGFKKPEDPTLFVFIKLQQQFSFVKSACRVDLWGRS